MRKTLLLLGGSQSQVVAIAKAKDLGYRTVLCDYLSDNPGRKVSDKYYCVSTTDKDAILEVALQEHIDGIVAYGSDPAAPTAAFVSEQLGLPGIPYETARDFCEKHRFRSLLRREGFCVPGSVSLVVDENHRCLSEPVSDIAELRYPLIVKPSDSSGSKGVTVVRDERGLQQAINGAAPFARNGVVEVEEFVVACHSGVIEAEVFVWDGKVVSWGLMRCLRDSQTNPLLPAGYRHPLDMDDETVALIKRSIERLISVGGIKGGALNIEMIIDRCGNLFFLDVGPRNGGNMLPHFFSLVTGDDLVEGTLRWAMGESWDHSYYDGYCDGAWYMHVLHARQNGTLQGVKYSESALAALRYENIFNNIGDKVRPFMNSLDIVGLAMFKFNTVSQLDAFLDSLDKNVCVYVAK